METWVHLHPVIYSTGRTTHYRPKDMDEEHLGAIRDHLTEKRNSIFNSLVRMATHSNDRYTPVAYSSHDPRMIDYLVSHRKMNGGQDLGGPIDIRQMNGNMETFKDLQWFNDDDRFFLGEDENAPTDMRMLDLWPIDEEGSSWSNRVGDGGPVRGQRGYVEGKREAGLPEPGQFKATMATNPEFLDKYFPKVAEWMMDDDGETLGFENIFKAAINKEKPNPSPETYADGTPKNEIPDAIKPDAVKPDQEQGFSTFMKKAANQGLQAGVDAVPKVAGWLKRRGDDAIKLKKQMDDRRNNQL